MRRRGRKTLADLFAGCSQLIIHHLMFHPDWDAGCPGCSFQAEHIDGPGQHLEHHDVKIVAVSRAPLAKLAAYKRRMGWRFDWVSSYGSDFNFDFHVSFPKDEIAKGRVDYNFGTITVDTRYHSEELPGVSVFYKDQDGQIFHTYSTYARGLDAILGGNHYLDLTPKGRRDADYPNWPRRHDEYGEAASQVTNTASEPSVRRIVALAKFAPGIARRRRKPRWHLGSRRVGSACGSTQGNPTFARPSTMC